MTTRDILSIPGAALFVFSAIRSWTFSPQDARRRADNAPYGWIAWRSMTMVAVASVLFLTMVIVGRDSTADDYLGAGLLAAVGLGISTGLTGRPSFLVPPGLRDKRRRSRLAEKSPGTSHRPERSCPTSAPVRGSRVSPGRTRAQPRRRDVR